MGAAATLQVLVNGLLLGGLYALVAAGLNLVFGVLRVINVAHGELVVLAALVTAVLWEAFRLHPLLGLPVAVAVVATLAYLAYRLVVRRVVRAPELVTLLVHYGLSVFLLNAMLYVFQARYRSVPVFTGSLPLGPVAVSEGRGLAFLLAAAITAAVWLFLHRTDAGRALRAVAQHPDVAAACGIDVERVRSQAYVLGAGLAAAAGALLSFILAVSPGLAPSMVGRAFAICVLGGLGSFPGALLGGFLLALAESFVSYAYQSQAAEAVGYVLLVGTLLLRPQGLLGGPR